MSKSFFLIKSFHSKFPPKCFWPEWKQKQINKHLPSLIFLHAGNGRSRALSKNFIRFSLHQIVGVVKLFPAFCFLSKRQIPRAKSSQQKAKSRHRQYWQNELTFCIRYERVKRFMNREGKKRRRSNKRSKFSMPFVYFFKITDVTFDKPHIKILSFKRKRMHWGDWHKFKKLLPSFWLNWQFKLS